jgi:NADH:ubiquinone reductase (H+-translocating)
MERGPESLRPRGEAETLSRMIAGPQRRPPHVVVVGGGFAGLNAARELARAPGEVVLVARRNHHDYHPQLDQVATGALSPADIAAPLRHVLRRRRNARVLLGEVVDFAPERRAVVLADGELEYDTLVVASGSRPSYFGHDEWEADAPGLKDLEDARLIRARVLAAYERAERATEAGERRRWMTFAIVGGGATGVELAGALAELARDTLERQFRAIDSRAARIVLIEGADRILTTYRPRLSEHARRSLERLRVEVWTDAKVSAVAPGRLEVRRGERTESLEAATIVWAAGVRASELGAKLAERAGAPLDRSGRVQVAPDLTLPGRPEIFVIGDLASVAGRDGRPLPGVAPVAMQEGRYVGKAVKARLEGRDVKPFRYRDRGNMAVIGRKSAVAELRGRGFSGYWAWLLWLFVHLMYLVGFANRLLVLIQWAWNYFTHNRTARLITGEVPVPGTEERTGGAERRESASPPRDAEPRRFSEER